MAAKAIKAKQSKQAVIEPKYPRITETYHEPYFNVQDEPSAFNGMIRFRKYRITVELLDEPLEILRERLIALWHSLRRNMHLVDAMREKAKEIGMDPNELKLDECGRDFKGDGF